MRCMLVATDPGAPARPTFPEVPGAIEVGRTDRAVVHVDAVMGGRGRRIAEAILDSVEEEIDSIAEHFGNLALPDLPLNVVVAQLPGVERAYHHAASSADLFIDARTMPAIEPRYSRFLLSTLLVDLFLDASGRAWSPGDSHGEALSRALATSAYPRQISGFATAAVWLDGDRPDLVSSPASGQDDAAAVGLGVLFLNWLHFQLGHLWEDIIACAAATLAESYYRLVGDAEDAFAAFSREVEAIYPAGRPSELATDNPFPRARPVPAEDAVAAREAPAEPAIPSVDDAEPSSAEGIDAAAEETWSGEELFNEPDQSAAADTVDGEGLGTTEEGVLPPVGDELVMTEEPVQPSAAADAPGQRSPRASTIRRALVGAAFPVSRSGLVESARNNNASARVLAVLSGLPARRYQDRADVLAALEEAQ